MEEVGLKPRSLDYQAKLCSHLGPSWLARTHFFPVQYAVKMGPAYRYLCVLFSFLLELLDLFQNWLYCPQGLTRILTTGA